MLAELHHCVVDFLATVVTGGQQESEDCEGKEWADMYGHEDMCFC